MADGIIQRKTVPITSFSIGFTSAMGHDGISANTQNHQQDRVSTFSILHMRIF